MELSLETFNTLAGERTLPPATCHKNMHLKAQQWDKGHKEAARILTTYHQRRREIPSMSKETKWGRAEAKLWVTWVTGWLLSFTTFLELTGARGLWGVRSCTQELGATGAHRRPPGGGLAGCWTGPALSLRARLELTCRAGWRRQSRKWNERKWYFDAKPSHSSRRQSWVKPNLQIQILFFLLRWQMVLDWWTELCNESYKLR